MGEHDVARRQRGRELVGDLNQRVIIGNKNLDVIAHFSDFRRRADEVWDSPQGPIPDKNVEALIAKIRGDSAPDYPETDDTDVFSHSTSHVTFYALLDQALARNQTEVKSAG